MMNAIKPYTNTNGKAYIYSVKIYSVFDNHTDKDGHFCQLVAL